MQPLNAISFYQQEQYDAVSMVTEHLRESSTNAVEALKTRCVEYRAFRNDVDIFLSTFFSETCTQKCYRNRLSACCQKEGIITFFADVVINALFSSPDDLDAILSVLRVPNTGSKCVYLGANGCLWRIKPIGCEMFLCDAAAASVFSRNPEITVQWESLKALKQDFTWPDHPVLFDAIEETFMVSGCSSSLMYFHNSPGLLRVKKQAGLLSITAPCRP